MLQPLSSVSSFSMHLKPRRLTNDKYCSAGTGPEYVPAAEIYASANASSTAMGDLEEEKIKMEVTKDKEESDGEREAKRRERQVGCTDLEENGTRAPGCRSEIKE